MEGVTKSDVIMGTPGYMAPEQAGGQSKLVGPPADVYGLGAMLYAALSGKPPFEAESQLATVLQVLTQEPPSLSSIRGDVPRSLETICLKCLAKRPEDRYPTALALADDLKRFRIGDPITALAPASEQSPTVSEIVALHPHVVPSPVMAELAARPGRKRALIAGTALLLIAAVLLVWKPWASALK